MNSIDQQFVEYIVKSLVSKPDEVKIERRIDEKGVLLELTVDPEDLGRVIVSAVRLHRVCVRYCAHLVQRMMLGII